MTSIAHGQYNPAAVNADLRDRHSVDVACAPRGFHARPLAKGESLGVDQKVPGNAALGGGRDAQDRQQGWPQHPGQHQLRQSWEKGQTTKQSIPVPLSASRRIDHDPFSTQGEKFLDDAAGDKALDFLLSSDWLEDTTPQMPRFQVDQGLAHAGACAPQGSKGGDNLDFDVMRSSSLEIDGDLYVTTQGGFFSPNASPRSSMSMFSDMDRLSGMSGLSDAGMDQRALDQRALHDFQSLVQGGPAANSLARAAPAANSLGTLSKPSASNKTSASGSSRPSSSSSSTSGHGQKKSNSGRRSYTVEGRGRGGGGDDEEDQFLQPMQTVNMNDVLSGCKSKVGLCRPLMGPNGRVIFGTWSELSEEELRVEGAERSIGHHIICTQMQTAWSAGSPGMLQDGPGADQVMDQRKSGKYSMQITDRKSVQGSVIDMQFLNPSKVVVASGSVVSIVDVGVSGYADGSNGAMRFGLDDARPSPALVSGHTDMLREIAVGEGAYVASGGYDGNLIMTQIGTMGVGHTMGQFKTGGVIGSVKFHPTMKSVVSFTKDEGVLMLWDAGTGKSVAEYKSVQQNSYTHSWDGDNTAIMGFAKRSPNDLHLEFVDVRKLDKKRRKKRWEKRKKLKRGHLGTELKFQIADPHLDTIGDILVVPGSRHGRRYICFGEPGFSVFDGNDAFDRQHLLPSCTYLSSVSDEIQTSGCIVPNSNSQSLLMTDSFGNVSFFALPEHLAGIEL